MTAPTEQIPVLQDGRSIRVIGHVTSHTRHLLKDAIVRGLEVAMTMPDAAVLIDFALAGTLDSTAITALVSGAHRCQTAGRELILSNLTPEYREVLERLTPSTPFTFAEDLPQ